MKVGQWVVFTRRRGSYTVARITRLSDKMVWTEQPPYRATRSDKALVSIVVDTEQQAKDRVQAAHGAFASYDSSVASLRKQLRDLENEQSSAAEKALLGV